METIFINTENRKTNEPYNFFLGLSQRLYLKSLNKPVALKNLFVYNTWKSIKQQYKNNKLKTIAPTCQIFKIILYIIKKRSTS